MSNNHLRLNFPCSTGYWESMKKPRSSNNQTGNGCVMDAHLSDRTNDRNRSSIYSSLPRDVSYFPFWARKCGCAECIIAGDKMRTSSVNNSQNGYKNSNQSECFSQTTNGYNQGRQTKGRLGEDQVYKEQRMLGSGNGIAVWPEKDRFTTSSGKMQTREFNTYIQNQADPRTSTFYQPVVCSQSAATTVVDQTNQFTRLLNTDSVVSKGNEAVAKYWPWCGTSNEFNYQNEQYLLNIHQTSPTKQISRDPRLRNKRERSNGNGALTSNKDSLYQGNANFVPVSGTGKIEGYARQSEENKIKRNREKTKHDSLQETTPAAWWKGSPMGQYPKLAHAPVIYPERSAPATVKKDEDQVPGDERKGHQAWGKQPMQLTLNELSNKRGISDTFFQGSDSHNNFPWNNTTLSPAKTCRTSEGELPKGTKWTPKELQNFSSKKKHGTSDLDPFQKGNSLQNKQKLRIQKKDLEKDKDAKTLEIYAREERIRNLKTLLVKHEQALDALRFQRKPFLADGTNENIVNFTGNETPSQELSDEEHIVGNRKEFCSSPGPILGNSLKRRWLKNWNGEDHLDHKPPQKIVKRNDAHSHGTPSEDGNQNLSNAEFTALEGLVRLSKD